MTVRHRVLICLLAVMATLLGSAAPLHADALLEGFHNPPLPARPSVYWAWVNGLTNKERMTTELEEMKAKGIGGVYIFDIGAQDPKGIVPKGPAFMGPESLDAIGHTVREATRLGMEVGLVTSSSWNCGGPWIPPRYASMGLYHQQIAVTGPTRLDTPLPLPSLPARAPRDADGKPAYLKNVAILAIPAPKRLAGHEFVFELAPPGTHTIDRVVLYNTLSGDEKRYGPMHLFAKDFVVYASADSAEPDSLQEIVRGIARTEHRRSDVPLRSDPGAIRQARHPVELQSQVRPGSVGRIRSLLYGWHQCSQRLQPRRQQDRCEPAP